MIKHYSFHFKLFFVKKLKKVALHDSPNVRENNMQNTQTLSQEKFDFGQGKVMALLKLWTPCKSFECHFIILMYNNNVLRILNQRTNGPVNAHLSLLHIPINMFEYYGI